MSWRVACAHPFAVSYHLPPPSWKRSSPTPIIAAPDLHFPDQLLSIRKSCLKSLYRYPFDVLEELSTSCSSRVVVNSGFTRKVYLDTFRCCRHEAPQIVYPCIEVKGPDENR